MTVDKPIPIQRENREDDFAVGYMDLTDFRYELGARLGGNVVYPSIEDCRKHREGCIDECGIVEVEVRARKIVQPRVT